MQVSDIMGRSIEFRINLQTDANLQVGEKYK
jgi:hypothetical protein